VSTTLTYFVVQLCGSRPSPLPTPHALCSCSPPRVSSPPRLRRPGWNCDCNSNYLISTIASLFFDSRHTWTWWTDASRGRGTLRCRWDEGKRVGFANGITFHGIARRIVTQFKSRDICRNGTWLFQDPTLRAIVITLFRYCCAFRLYFFMHTVRAFNMRCIWKVSRYYGRRLALFIGRSRGCVMGEKILREELIMSCNYMWVLLQFLILYFVTREERKRAIL